jgi:hypothetical protein
MIEYERHGYRTRVWHRDEGYLGSIVARRKSNGTLRYAAGWADNDRTLETREFTTRARAAEYLYEAAVARKVAGASQEG